MVFALQSQSACGSVVIVMTSFTLITRWSRKTSTKKNAICSHAKHTSNDQFAVVHR